MKTPKTVRSLHLECDCTSISKKEWDKLMSGATRANKRIIDRLVKNHIPSLYWDLALNYSNPYVYYKTDTHLILVHSSIEYFLKYD